MDQDVPAAPIDEYWSFQAAHSFLSAFANPSLSTHISAFADTELNPSTFHLKAGEPNSLGDFNRLWQYRGLPLDVPHALRSRTRHRSTESSSSQLSTSTTPTTPDEGPQDAPYGRQSRIKTGSGESEDFDSFVAKAKGVRWKDEVPGLSLSESRRRSTHPLADDVDFGHLHELLEHGVDSDDKLCFTNTAGESLATPEKLSVSQHSTPYHHIVLRSSRNKAGPVPLHQLHQPPALSPIPSFFKTAQIQPIYTLTATEKAARLVRKMIKKDLLDSSTDASAPLSKWGSNNDPAGVHVFIDLSNIVIGFFEKLKADRRIPKCARPKKPPMSFHSLAFIFERDRKVARRVLAGSHREYIGGVRTKRPWYMLDAENCGYETNILEPVEKTKEQVFIRKKKHGTGNGYATTSGQSSGSDGASFRRVNQEQCVDEILQMKMLESLVDFSEPATMILASGDAAEAEYSGGFFKTVERFLKKGWKVELFAWSAGLSWEYRSKNFLSRWKGNFRVIELDDFSEELLAIYTFDGIPRGV